MIQRPNIVFIFSDQQHWRAVGHRDPFFRTPNIDQLASQSVVFDHAFCTTPQCSPSRSSILTGFYPSQTGVMGNIGSAGGKPLAQRTIGAMLQDVGYHTAYFGKWHLGKEPVAVAGWDAELGVSTAETHDDANSVRRATAYLSERKVDASKPFALFISLNNPHDVYKWRSWSGKVPADVPLADSCREDALNSKPPVQREFMLADQGKGIHGAERSAWQKYRTAYAAMVADFDNNVGRIIDQLRSLDLLDETLLVVTSDHGDMDTHHGLIFKGPFMYDQMIRVPAYVRLPKKFEGIAPQTSNAMLINTDWVPTLLDAARAQKSPCDGCSLWPLLRGENGPGRKTIVSQYFGKQSWVNPIRCIRSHDYKYVRYRSGDEELYDLNADPQECINVLSDPSYVLTRQQLSAELDDWIDRHHDPFSTLTPTDRQGLPIEHQAR